MNNIYKLIELKVLFQKIIFHYTLYLRILSLLFMLDLFYTSSSIIVDFSYDFMTFYDIC